LHFPVNKAAGRLLCGLLSCALLLGSAQAAPRQTNRSKEKAAAEASRAAIQQKLGALKKDITRTESEKEDAADELSESEEAISNANRALRELGDEQTATNAKLRELAGEQEKLAATIAAQKNQLAKLLRQHYVAGNEDRIKLLLSGDNPNRINRDLQMMAYVSQAQARLLTSLRGNLARSRKTASRPRTPRTNWKKSPASSATRRRCWKKKRPSARRCWPTCRASWRTSASRPAAWSRTNSA
jgi:septal ring factor EnvC (AmiA/AmiB activator)